AVTNHSRTNLTLSLRNSASTPMSFQTYRVSVISGDMWTLANWTGPTLSPGSTSPAVISIGSSCNACAYKGIIDLFQQFVPTHTYLITITTKLNTQFTFTIVF